MLRIFGGNSCVPLLLFIIFVIINREEQKVPYVLVYFSMWLKFIEKFHS